MTTPLNQPPDAIGASLQSTMIWARAGASSQLEFVAFRRRFALPETPATAVLHLFADVRYLLWVNGEYVTRGPARFEPTGPEYDTVVVTGFLRPGDNVLVVLVMANGSNGKMRQHTPGLTARLEFNGEPARLASDPSWKWSDQVRYRAPEVDWGNVMDRIDARVEDGDWTQPDYDDGAWQTATAISGDSWGPLSARRIPPLRETEVPAGLPDESRLPVTLTANQTLTFTTDQLVQAYTVLEIDAEDGSELSLEYCHVDYVARAGRQTYVSSDTYGFFGGSITVRSGRVTIHQFRLVERLYPFEIAGSFQSNDETLNQLWWLCARSCQVLSEDAYVDCADRERTEWMDDDPPGFDITRTAMSGPAADGGRLYADPRLLGELLRRTALTLQPEGWVKAHTCSDRFDIHAKMEDRACDWVQGARRYYESTGDPALIREIWPVIARQLCYFLERRTVRGLVLGREWEVWGNPVGYVTCEGAGLNAFVYKALCDAAYLGGMIGENSPAAEFEEAASELARAFNDVLWDEGNGTYYSGYTEDYAGIKGAGMSGTEPVPPAEGNLIASTMFPALWALDQGIVPEARRARVANYLEANRQQAGGVMTVYYLFQHLYRTDTAAFDREILQTMREKWEAMLRWPWQTTWEDFQGGSKAHIYGMYPGYFLSSHVLGVRLDGPVWDKRLLIEPRLGGLTAAEGVVVTEHGPVPVSWKVAGSALEFCVEVPPGVGGTLRVPQMGGHTTLTLDGNPTAGKAEGRYLVAEVGPGTHHGTVMA